MKKRLNLGRQFIVTLLCSIPMLVWGQEERNLAPVSRTYAITNVNVIQSPGRKVEWGMVIVKDGLIKAVGKNLPIPADAIVIKADSMYVYAGFIDGLSHTGVGKPKDEQKEKVKDPGNPPPDRAGITPEADVRTFLNPAEKSIEELRAIGFTAAHVVPYGRILPGSGSVILLGGNSVDQMVIGPKASMYAELTGAERMYPNTVIAVMAKWRELYKQATLAKSYENMYASNRSGLERPKTDRVLEAFYPVIDKRMPVYFHTQKFLDAQRAIALQNDLGFPLVICDVKEGWDLIPKVKSSGSKIFLSLELPEEKKDEKKDDATASKSDNDAERQALEKRREEFIAKYVGQAAQFQKEGIVFGFSTKTVKTKDIQANLRRIIKAGLSEDQALAALTTNPAQLLGMSDRIGSVDNGKIANLVISDKPYFNEKSRIRYVFVDGVMYKMDVTDKPKSEVRGDVAGNWTVSMETPKGKRDDKLKITKDGSSYKGTLSGAQLTQVVNLESVEVNGKNLKLKFTLPYDGQPVKFELDAVVEGDTFKGSANVASHGSFAVEGKKDPNK